MSGDEAGARKPQIGDVWRCTYGQVVEDVLLSDYAEDVDDWTEALNDPEWNRHNSVSLVGRVVPVDHPGIEPLREVVARGSLRWLGQSDYDAAVSSLADLLSLLAPSPGGST